MTWTGKTFNVGDILTAAQMNNLQADITAQANGDSGAPKQQNASLALFNTVVESNALIGPGVSYPFPPGIYTTVLEPGPGQSVDFEVMINSVYTSLGVSGGFFVVVNSGDLKAVHGGGGSSGTLRRKIHG